MTLLLKFVIDLSRLFIGISSLFTICNCDKDFNLTFYNESKTWSDAKDFCFGNGGILETDETIIRTDHDYTKEHVKLWLGTFSMITPWAGVFGCYLWNADGRIESRGNDFQNKEECQIRCPQSNYEFFVFKGESCYCFTSEKLPHDEISPKNCSDSTETDYVFIYKLNIRYKLKIIGHWGLPLLICLSRIQRRIPLTYTNHRKNTKNRSAINFYNATKFCENEDSFVRWDPSSSCSNSKESFESKYWTSITRSKQMFRVTAYDENITLMPSQCKGIETSEDGNKFVGPSFVSCKELRSFYCRYDSLPLINSTPNESPEHNVTMELPDNGHVTRYIIPGAIAGTTLLAIIVGVVIFVFRRRSTERKADVRQDVQRSNNAEQIGHGKNLNRYSYSEVKVEGSNQHDNMNDDGDDQYTTGSSDVYDHLNENKNRKIKTENPHAIYDHAIGDNAESDYDSTKHVVPTNLDYQEVRIGSEEESLALN